MTIDFRLVLVSAAVFTSTAHADPKVDPKVVPPVKPRVVKVGAAQLKPVAKFDSASMQRTIDAAKASLKPHTPIIKTDKSRIVSGSIGEGVALTCDSPVTLRLRVQGGTTTTGQHSLIVYRTYNPWLSDSGEVARGTNPDYAFRIDLSLNANEVVDYVFTPPWKVRCFTPSATSNEWATPGTVESYVALLVLPHALETARRETVMVLYPTAPAQYRFEATESSVHSCYVNPNCPM